VTASYALLEGETLLHLRGADIAGFLQGQLTCDLRDLGPQRAVCGAYCTAQGRVLADVMVLQVAEEHSVLRLRRGIAAGTAAHLAHYARFSRIAVEEDAEQYRLVGVTGPDPSTALAALDLPAPTATGDVRAAAGGIVVATGERQRELLMTAAQYDALAARLDSGARAMEESAWRAEELAAGRYRIDGDDVGEHVPQVLNYDRLGWISFQKGCYTGQEVIARLHYRGRAKRRLALYAGEADLEPAPACGDTLILASGAGAAEILRVERRGDGDLVVAALAPADAQDTPAHTGTGATLTALPTAG
jgi:folate-binding protein YgfZ